MSGVSQIRKKSGAVLVLGDLGRSPRMQTHADIIASHSDYQVDLIGYKGSKLNRSTQTNPNITVHYIHDIHTPSIPQFLAVLLLPIKLLHRFLSALFILLTLKNRPCFLLVQNPPSHPTFLLAKLYCLFFNCRFLIDWHNLGYSIMGLKKKGLLANKHATALYEWLEVRLGKTADGNLCVSRAMSLFLRKKLQVETPIVLYDIPNKIHRRATVEETHKLFFKYRTEINAQRNPFEEEITGGEATLLTRGERGEYTYKAGRPIVLVTSTSFTPDEDISVLLEAIRILDQMSGSEEYLFLITGKGPLKEYYQMKAKELNLQRCAISMIWLESYEDYSMLLGSCDAGISLHYSSSGLDLPMKIYDMFGCGLPVFSIEYKCIGELVKNGENGWLFGTAQELAKLVSQKLKPGNNLTELKKKDEIGKLRDLERVEWAQKIVNMLA